MRVDGGIGNLGGIFVVLIVDEDEEEGESEGGEEGFLRRGFDV